MTRFNFYAVSLIATVFLVLASYMFPYKLLSVELLPAVLIVLCILIFKNVEPKI